MKQPRTQEVIETLRSKEEDSNSRKMKYQPVPREKIVAGRQEHMVLPEKKDCDYVRYILIIIFKNLYRLIAYADCNI